MGDVNRVSNRKKYMLAPMRDQDRAIMPLLQLHELKASDLGQLGVTFASGLEIMAVQWAGPTRQV